MPHIPKKPTPGDDFMRTCPSCGEELSQNYERCPYCDEDLGDAQGDGDGDAEEKDSDEPDEDEGEKETGHLVGGKYIISQPFHFTPFQAVYKAEDAQERNQFYSIREFLLLSDLLKKQRGLERFLEFAERLTDLDHPNMARLLHCFQEGNSVYLVYDYVDGKNMRQLLTYLKNNIGTPVPEELVVNWGIKLCDLLTYVHNQPEPLYCIDMKPSSIVLDSRREEAVYINTGLPYFLDALNLFNTQDSLYISEVKEEFLSARRDIFCLGAILFFLLTGVDLQREKNPVPPPLRVLRNDVSQSVATIIGKALGEEGFSFYDEAEEMKEELMETRRSLPLRAFDFYGDLFGGRKRKSSGWPFYMGNMGRTNSLGPGPRESLWLRWKASAPPGTVTFLVPVDQGILCVSSTGDFQLNDRQTGALLEKKSLKRPLVAPVTTRSTAYLASAARSVYALNLEDFTEEWDVEVGDMIMASPCLHKEGICVITYDGFLYVLDYGEGELQWQESFENRIISSPAVADDKFFIGALNGYIYCIDMESRGLLWDYNTEGSISASVAVEGDTLFAGNHHGVLLAINTAEGDLLWEREMEGSISQPVRSFHDMIYVMTMKGVLTALDSETGEIAWTRRMERPVDHAMALTNNKLFLTDNAGGLYSIEAFTGKIRQKTSLGDLAASLPLPVGEYLYVATQSGTILCLG
jgi:outer membrane protein assembly factor BamB